MSITDLAVAGVAGVVGFLLIWGLFSLIRKQKTPPVAIVGSAPRPARDGAGTLSVAELGATWHTILGVPAGAALADIEAAYHARLAECDRIRFSSGDGAREKQNAQERRAQINDAYEFIRGAKR